MLVYIPTYMNKSSVNDTLKSNLITDIKAKKNYKTILRTNLFFVNVS